jgi:hypothetical protein
MVLNLSSWLALSGDNDNPEAPPEAVRENENPEQAARRAERQARARAEQKARGAAAREAFKPENDRLLITARPVQDGFRMRFQFDEGFIKFLGLRAADQLDKTQL